MSSSPPADVVLDLLCELFLNPIVFRCGQVVGRIRGILPGNTHPVDRARLLCFFMREKRIYLILLIVFRLVI